MLKGWGWKGANFRPLYEMPLGASKPIVPHYLRQSPIGTRRYLSFGNRYLRSVGLVVRLDGEGGGTTTICSGNCSQGIEYGSAGTTKLLEYIYSGGSLTQVATTGDWIKFVLSVESESQVGTRAVVYQVSMFRTKYLNNCSFYANNYRGFFGDEDIFYLHGPVRAEAVLIGNGQCGYEYATLFYHHSPNAWLVAEDIFDCSDGGLLNYDPDNEYELWQQYQVYEPGHTYNIDTAPVDTLSSYTPSITPCSGTDPDPIDTARIDIYDPSGLIHTGYAPTGTTAPPSITITETSEGGGAFAVQSSEYPQVWYQVPTDYSACTCPDFTQQVSQPSHEARSWVGSNAGGFNPCKHIMAVKRVLQVPQFYTDYVPYIQNTLDGEYVRYDDGESNRLSGHR